MTENCPYCLHQLPDSKNFGPLKAIPEANVVILGHDQYKLSTMQTKLMVLFIDKFNLPVGINELHSYLYGEGQVRSKHAIWMHIKILSDRIARTGYKIDHVCSSTWRLCKDEPIRKSNGSDSGT